MKATQRDIDFCLLMVKALSGPTPGEATDFYWQCVRREKALTAALYQEAADLMTRNGKWYMPTETELQAAHDLAWDTLHA